MSFRRPPSDVDRMTSLRVDNLPYSAVMEVAWLCDFQVATTFRKHHLMNVWFLNYNCLFCARTCSLFLSGLGMLATSTCPRYFWWSSLNTDQWILAQVLVNQGLSAFQICWMVKLILIYPQGAWFWQVSWLCLCALLRQARCRGKNRDNWKRDQNENKPKNSFWRNTVFTTNLHCKAIPPISWTLTFWKKIALKINWIADFSCCVLRWDWDR